MESQSNTDRVTATKTGRENERNTRETTKRIYPITYEYDSNFNLASYFNIYLYKIAEISVRIKVPCIAYIFLTCSFKS